MYIQRMYIQPGRACRAGRADPTPGRAGHGSPKCCIFQWCFN